MTGSQSFAIKVYAMYHDEPSGRIVQEMTKKYPYMTPFKLQQNKLYESQIFLAPEMDQMIDKSYHFVGFVSYNYLNKVKTDEDILKACHRHRDRDVVALYDFNCDLLAQATRAHGDSFRQCWTTLLDRLGYSKAQVEDTGVPTFFCNFWLARPVWLARYVRFIKSAVQVIESDQTLQRLISSNSLYKGNLKTDQLIRISGSPFYTLHPFIFERLPCFFFYHSGAVIGRRSLGDWAGKYVKDVAEDMDSLLSGIKDVAIFAVHSCGGQMPANTVLYIQQLTMHFECVLIVCTSMQALASYSAPEKVKTVFAPNMCHDFGLWFRIVPHLPKDVSRVALINDSCYLLKPLSELFVSPPLSDFWGVSDSYEIAHHLQSYFTVFEKKAVESLKKFVLNIDMCHETMMDKWHVVSAFEIGLSQFMIRNNHRPHAVYPIKKLKLFNTLLHNLDRDNSTWFLWDRLLVLGCPLLKKKRCTYDNEYEFIQSVTDIKD